MIRTKLLSRTTAQILHDHPGLAAATEAHPKGQATVNTKPCDWRAMGECLTEDPELFFPVGTGGPALLQAADAKAVCRRCPVAVDCLAWALDTGQNFGVWGGLAEDERRALRRRMGW